MKGADRWIPERGLCVRYHSRVNSSGTDLTGYEQEAKSQAVTSVNLVTAAGDEVDRCYADELHTHEEWLQHYGRGEVNSADFVDAADVKKIHQIQNQRNSF